MDLEKSELVRPLHICGWEEALNTKYQVHNQGSPKCDNISFDEKSLGKGPYIKKRESMVFEHRGEGEGVTQNQILIQISLIVLIWTFSVQIITSTQSMRILTARWPGLASYWSVSGVHELSVNHDQMNVWLS